MRGLRRQLDAMTDCTAFVSEMRLLAAGFELEAMNLKVARALQSSAQHEA
jgi:hypothetical protein